MTPSEEEVLGYFSGLSNWGRWGENDELGTLNLITPEKRVQAIATVRDGQVVSCSAAIEKGQNSEDVPYPPTHYMIRSGESLSPGRPGHVDFIGMVFHGLTTTHIDALSHSYWNGQLYNGRDRRVVTTELGATELSIDVMKEGIFTKGVLLDIPALKSKPYLEPGEPIFPEDLEAAERLQEVRVESGDALLIRTGWWSHRAKHGPVAGRSRPGLHAATLPWLHSRSVAVLATDAANDVIPSGFAAIEQPIHEVCQVSMGMPLIDVCQFDDLLALCIQRKRYECLFTVAPLRISFGTGSPVNPIAIL